MGFSVAILTVSDSVFSSASTDKSGPALRNLLSSITNSPFTVTSSAIVPDSQSEIKRVVQVWANAGIQLVITTGGTGFGTRDGTPEAITQLITKPAPGLVAAMLSHSLSITPLGALSRPVAGVHIPSSKTDGTGTMVITLPGSPRGATENLEALLGVLPHALELACGAPGGGKEVHELLKNGKDSEALQMAGAGIADISAGAAFTSAAGGSSSLKHDHSHSHHHHHHHHHHNHGGGSHVAPKPRTLLSQDPTSAADRQRKSPYPMVSVREAMSLIFDNTPTSNFEFRPVDESLVGAIIAEDVESSYPIPQAPTTNVDGYAVKSTDPPGVYNVMLQFPSSPVPAGSVYRINTGAPLPPGTDSVIMVEDTKVHTRYSETEGGEEKEVELLAQVDLGENVRKAGSDVTVGEKVLEKGDVISAVGGELGTLAFVGKKSVKVHRRPIVAVLSTGNELHNILDPPRGDSSFSGIPDSNRPSLISILKHLHFDVLDLGIVVDTMEETKKALKKGKEEADVIITTGGTSMGVGDLLKPCIERELNGTVHFGRVAMKPGKPTTFATLPPHPMAPSKDPKLVFALPGNPASALVTFFLFVLPALRKMEGRKETEWELPRVPVQISSAVYLDPRPEYHRVWLRPTVSSNGVSLKAFSTGGQRSSRTVSLAGANGLLELPALKEGEARSDKIDEGSVVQCVVVGEIGSWPA
ncbi:hypothetical protein T439DRAFT_325750 [Meredithblackwellia eburnea MCA 4105]